MTMPARMENEKNPRPARRKNLPRRQHLLKVKANEKEKRILGTMTCETAKNAAKGHYKRTLKRERGNYVNIYKYKRVF